jgi:hypothetical protein
MTVPFVFFSFGHCIVSPSIVSVYPFDSFKLVFVVHTHILSYVSVMNVLTVRPLAVVARYHPIRNNNGHLYVLFNGG